jgi:glycosyltransferase involved in cell wall biosynthesis
MSRYGFILPRYFEGIAGGAETLMGALAAHLSARGDTVEIFTTCAKDNRTWSNEFEPGTVTINGIPVRRYMVDERNLDRWIPIQLAIHDNQEVSIEAQLEWMTESVNSSSLYSSLARVGESFDALFFGPYLFGTTFWGSLIHPHKSILIPCLHDESYAYQQVIASMFRQVRGCLFNAAPEMALARSLYGPIAGGVVGMGFVPPTDEALQLLKPYFDKDFPYILYLGRKETGKNVQLLIDHFCSAKSSGLIREDVKLVVLGGGSFEDLHRPDVLSRGDVLDLPHASESEKQQLLKHALYLCQPSTNESFSIVLMEAWMVGTPVVVHSACAVTHHHVVEAGAGLYFSTAEDLGGVTEFLLSNSSEREKLAVAGREYVQREYSWVSVLDRFDVVVQTLHSGTDKAVPI